MHWLAAVDLIRRERRAGILVTVTEVRGHAPQTAGAKMVVALQGAPSLASRTTTRPDAWGTVGGGNLEETALVRASELLAGPPGPPEQLTLELNEKAHTDHGRQCCGGQVTLLFEHLPVVPAVAVFGAGHVGVELARILCRHDLDLHLVDSRAERVDADALAFLDDGPASVHRYHSLLPELVLAGLPRGCHVLVMTHDHAEDFALCDAALRCGHLASIGLIGSSAKWRRFQQRLAAEGHSPAAIARIQCPIGLRGLGGKEPAAIAVGVAADLLPRLASVGAADRVGR